MHIPEHIVEQIRSQNDIVEVIGEHVRLQKRGKNYLGLCPFHSEKTPSFNVNPELGIFKCFGCGKSGNVFKFLMEHSGCTFPESIQLLAHRAGITLESEDQTQEQREKLNRSDLAHRALAAAAEYYSAQLYSKGGRLAMKYFAKREFSDEIMHAFALGYSPDDWQKTTNELIRQNFSEQTLEDAGLIIRREDGSIHDRFRGRAMFPILDSMGRTAGFGARILTDDKSQAKYVNSPQSLVYDKSRILYGLFQAKQSIRQHDRAILTEGYADTISLHQFGFTNTVASSGTSLTVEQLNVLSRYTKNLVILYDGDDAGINAAMRGLELALQAGFEVGVVSLPDKEDPDTFVRSHGAEVLASYIKDARSFVDFLAERYKSQGMFSTPKGMAEAVRSLMKLVAFVGDPIQREFLIRSLAQKFSLREELLYAELSTSSGLAHPNNALAKRNVSGTRRTSRAQPRAKAPLLLLSEERALLRLALGSEEVLRSMEQEFDIHRETFPTPAAQRIFQAIEHAFHNGVEIASLLTESESLTDEDRAIITEILFSEEHPSVNWARFDIDIVATDFKLVIPDALLRLRLHSVLSEFRQLQLVLKDSPEDSHVLQRFHQLNKMRNDLEDEIRQLKPELEEED